MATQLGIYRDVAQLVGQPRFNILTDETELRYVLDDAYSDAVDFVLTRVPWRFATVEATVTEDAGAPAYVGYDYARGVPSDSLRIVSVFVSSAAPRSGDLPIDCRIHGGYIYSNHAGGGAGPLRVSYISTNGRTEANWPVEFSRVVAAYLAFLATQRITALNGRTDDLYGYYQNELTSAAQREAFAESPWLMRQLDGSFLASVRYVLAQGAWKFALKSATLSPAGGGTPLPGFANEFDKPADHVLTHSVFSLSMDGDERPIDVREHEEAFSSDASTITIRYVSDAYVHTPVAWPEQFTRCVAAHLGIDLGDMPVRQAADGSVVEREAVWPQYLARALDEFGVRPDPWLPKQLDGSFAAASRYVLSQGAWKFASVEADLAAGIGTPAPGFDNIFDKPSDLLYTHSIYVSGADSRKRPIDAREHGDTFSSNLGAFSIRYVSRSVLSAPETWPEYFVRCIGAYLGIDRGDFPVRQTADGSATERPAVWPEYLARALEQYAFPIDPWLPKQLDGSFAATARYMLAQGPWKFAVIDETLAAEDIGTPAPGFAEVFNKPAGWLNTYAVYVADASGLERPVNFREHDGTLSANIDAISVRYVSDAAIDDVTSWPEQFFRCVGAFLGIDVGDFPVRQTADGSVVERSAEWPAYLARALMEEAYPANPWLPKQLDGSFHKALRFILGQASWKFALKSGTLSPAGSGSPLPGFDNLFDKPLDHVLTHAVFTLGTGGKERPIDVREHAKGFSCDLSAISLRYVSADALDDPLSWPEKVFRCVGAYLGLDQGDLPVRQTADGSVTERAPVWTEYVRDAVREYALRPDQWLPRQVDGSFAEAARFILTQGPWKFATIAASLSAAISGTPAPGYTSIYNKPSGWVSAYSIFTTGVDGTERPVDVREEDSTFSANYASLAVRYVSDTVLATPGTWPEHFVRCVGAYLGIDEGDFAVRQAADGSVTERAPVWEAYVAQTLREQGYPENPWLAKQLDGSYHKAARYVLSQGAWKFAIAEETLTAAISGTPAPGFSEVFDRPATCVYYHSIFVADNDGLERPVNVRERDDVISANLDSISVRYVTDAVLDTPHSWPEQFFRCVGAYLGIDEGDFPVRRTADGGITEREVVWPQYLERALAMFALPRDPWLPKQLDGSFHKALRFILGQGAWKFALKSGTLSPAGAGSPLPGFDNLFDKPLDLFKVHALYTISTGGKERPIDVREHATGFSCDLSAISLRYTSSDVLEAPLTWPEEVFRCVGAYLGIDEGDFPVRQTADGSVTERDPVWREYLAHALMEFALRPNQWLDRQLDGTFVAAARYVLSQGAWKFAMDSAMLTPAGSGTPVSGYANVFNKPSGCVYVYSAYLTDADGMDRPIDVREQGSALSSNLSTFAVRFVSDAALTAPGDWPEQFVRCVGAYLGIDEGDFPVRQTADGSVTERSAVWPQYLSQALVEQGERPNPWLPKQLDGSFAAASRYILTLGPWKFAARASTLSPSGGTPSPGFSSVFDLPADNVLLYAVYVTDSTGKERPIDVREDDETLSANINSIQVRYISNEVLDAPLTWPEQFFRCIGAYLGIDQGDFPVRQTADGSVTERSAEWPQYLNRAMQEKGLRDNPWLPKQLDGSFAAASRYILTLGPWKFAARASTLSPSGGTPSPGFSSVFDLPADNVLLYAVYVTDSTGKERPVDVREDDETLSANINSIQVRYISNEVLDAPLTWPEQFFRCIGAYLGIDEGDFSVRQTADGSVTERSAEWPQYLNRAMQEKGLRDNPWLPKQLDGSYYQAARHVLSQGAWKFALKSGTLSPAMTGSPFPGFDNRFDKPTDFFAPHAIYTIVEGRERPIDVREHEDAFSSDLAAISLRYVSSDPLEDPLSWPEQFFRCVGAFLGIDVGDFAVRQTADGSVTERAAEWPQYLARALAEYAVRPDKWLPKQLDGSFAAAARHILAQGPWRFAVRTATRPADGGSTPLSGFANAFTKPAGFVLLYGLFGQGADGRERPVDAREHENLFSCNLSTIVLQYVTSDVLSTPTVWPEPFVRCIGAYLGIDEGDFPVRQTADGTATERPAVWAEYLAKALNDYGLRPNPWLRYQLDGSFTQALRTLVWEEDWHFARRTVASTASSEGGIGNFKFTHDMPAGSITVHRIYYVFGDVEYDANFRIEQGVLYADHEDVFIEYSDSNDYGDSFEWPGYFEDALLAYLAYHDAVGTPGTPGAVVNARLNAYKAALKDAKTADDVRDRPRLNREPGRFTSARYGLWRGYSSREDG